MTIYAIIKASKKRINLLFLEGCLTYNQPCPGRNGWHILSNS